MWITFLVFGLQREGYNLLLDPASELGRSGAPGARLFNVAFFLVPGISMVAFAHGLYRLLGARQPARVAAVLVALSGVSLAALGIVTMSDTISTLTTIHRAVGIPLLTALPAGVLLVGVSWPREIGRLSMRGLSLTIGCLLAVLACTYQLAGAFVPSGVVQRLSLLLLTIWMIAVSLRLLPIGLSVERTQSGK